MFRKLISNLPFTPSLVGQVSFYAKRMHQESTIRRAGFLLVALAMFIQMFAIIAPPEKSLAASDNNLINGIVNRDSIVNAWNADPNDIPLIYGKFGLTLADIQKLPQDPNVSITTNGGPDYWSVGRNSLSNYSNIDQQYKDSEVALQASLATTVYMRQLIGWDAPGTSSTYEAWQGTKADGTVFWILKDCGNYTQIGKFTPKNPGLELRKTIVGNPGTLKPGDSFTFRFEYRNNVPDSLAENVVLNDELDTANYDIVSPTNLPLNGNNLKLLIPNLEYKPTYIPYDITVRLKNPFPGTNGKTCNAAKLSSSNAPDAWGGPACVNVNTPCPINPAVNVGDAACVPPVVIDVCPNIAGNQASIPSGYIKDASGNCVKPVDFCPNIDGNQPSLPVGKILDKDGNCIEPCRFKNTIPANSSECVEPKLVCSLLDTDLDKTNRVATFKTTVISTNESAAKVISYVYDFGDGITATLASNTLTNTTKHTYASGEFNANVVVNYSIPAANLQSGTTSIAKSITCSDHISFESDKPLGQMKKVKNITQKLEGDKAVASKVNAGDVLEYTLITTNSQNYARKSFSVSDYVGDLTDYATIDKDFLATQGGTYDEATKKINWTNVSVDANKDVAKVFRITMKNPLPTTNKPTNVSGTFDCKISNKYGNEITMNITCPVVKKIETLPNTGPGTSALMGFMITAVVGYFFARSRLLSKELAIIRTEYTTVGGY
jgi:hypothetical protein